MPRTPSPLRYPGGKYCLLPLVSQILRENEFAHRPYAEPFAGGCGLALALLYGSHISDLYINDIDPAIWSFWNSVLYHTEDFCSLINSTFVTVDEWYKQHRIYLRNDLNDPLGLGFATFFLNRTNRSGVIKGAGVIGGLNQTGAYKIDCRYNTDDLVRRIRRVARYKRRIHLSRLDAIDFLQHSNNFFPRSTFIYIDPPYFDKGSSLYTSFYNRNDHTALAKCILELGHPWLLTYDDDNAIRELYSELEIHSFDLQYSLGTKRVGTELMITSSNIILPPSVTKTRVT